jgi:hypothetical protein
MLMGMETGIFPTIRVFRHFVEGQRYYQLKFASGEQALVLISGMPAPSVQFVRLALGGLVPWQTVWEFNPIRAGGYSDYAHKLKAMFSPATERSDDSGQCIRDALLSCPSIEDARLLLLQREQVVNSSIGADNFAPSRSNDAWELGIENAPQRPASGKLAGYAPEQHDAKRINGKIEEAFFGEKFDQTQIPTVPDRYRIRQDGKGRVLTCVEAPTIRIRAERALSISAKQARKYPPGTIFLDGVVQSDPFIDVQKEIYNLDHPEGCVRSLATCEQTMVLLRKGLDLRKRDWAVLANDGDLDTILALWVIFNHLTLSEDDSLRAEIIPLLRLAGILDSHGPEFRELAGLPPDLLQESSAKLKALQQQEVVLKNYGRWSETDLLEYIADRLRALDKMIYTPENFSGFQEIEELGRAQIVNGSVAVVCQSKADIDKAQRELQRIYGQRLAILIFQEGTSAYSVRRVDQTLAGTLERAYERLNLLDRSATGGAENRWGGSADMGASPRKTGTSLTPAQIVEAVREGFWEPTLFKVVSAIPRALLLAAVALSPALALMFIGSLLRDRGLIAGETALPAIVVLTVTVGILFWSKARQVPGLNGWRVPAGFGWLRVLPTALIGAAAGGVWASGSLAYRMGPENLAQFIGVAALLPPLAAELLFRGVILGNLAARLPIQKSGAWWHSWPTLISTALYSAASVLLFMSLSRGEIQMNQSLLIVSGSAIFGISSAVARERSESVLASVVLHWLCTAALLASRFLF